MMALMRMMWMGVLVASGWQAAGANAELAQIQTVYVLAMSNGTDQYLVNRLVKEGVFRVVTDPKLADAVITDRIGKGLEATLDEIYGPLVLAAPATPPPDPPEPKKETDGKEGDQKADDPKDEKTTEAKEDSKESEERPRISAFSRGKGTIFIVDRRNRQVLWSTFDRAKYNSPENLNNMAGRIVRQLKRDIGRN